MNILENKNLDGILKSSVANAIKLSEFSFLTPLEIAHLALICKTKANLLDQSELKGSAANFLSRMNFYTYVGITDPFGDNRYFGNNKDTLEVHEANNANQTIFDRVSNILANSQKNKEIVDRLLSELIGNAETYAQDGVVIGQVVQQQLYFAIVDIGPGIAKHLRENNQIYADWPDCRLILEALKKGVTCGRGKGFGLWQTREIILRNKGSFIIRSGNQQVDAIEGKCYEVKTPWIGTSIELRYNLAKPIDFAEILNLQNERAKDGESNDFGF